MGKIRRSVRLTPEEDKRAEDARWALRLTWQGFLLQAVEELVLKTRKTNGPKTLKQVFWGEAPQAGASEGASKE